MGATRGTTAIDINIPINGTMENSENSSPRLPSDAKIELKSMQINNIYLSFIYKLIPII